MPAPLTPSTGTADLRPTLGPAISIANRAFTPTTGTNTRADTDMSTSTEYLRESERDREREKEREKPMSSRPLSEISENESLRRASASASGPVPASNRSSIHSKKSRPTSEVKDTGSPTLTPTPNHANTSTNPTTSISTNSTPSSASKRMSTNMPLQTITVNLVEYARSRPASAAASGSGPQTPTLAPIPSLSISQTQSQKVNSAPPLPSPTSKPTPPDLPRRPGSAASEAEKSRVVSTSSTTSTKGKDREGEEETSQSDLSRPGVSTYLQSKRASLRPSSLSISYADVAKPISSPPATATSASVAASAFESLDSLSVRSSSVEIPPHNDSPAIKPTTKSKPSWLRRASGTAALRSKSRTPPPREDGIPTSTSPPVLPPRRGLEPTLEVPTSQSLPEDAMAPPPFPPRKSSFPNSAPVAGSSRSRLGDGQGRPAFSPASSSTGFAPPPPLPSRDNVGNIRGRIAAWTAAAQSSGSFNRSESSSSLASQAGGAGSSQQRFPVSAQRVLGHAGSAVQKGWAGLRSRGVGGSISSMSSLGQSSRRGFDSSPSWSSGLASKGRDRTQSDNYDFEPGSTSGSGGGSDGPVFESDSIRRAGQGGVGKVFGRDIVEAGKEWGVTDATVPIEGQTEWEKRRRKCLPAVVVRSVDYLETWGPKEEGIFRISGRSSHIVRLRKEFDSGADIDLTLCHPGDLDPHAVAGLFKSYLRELPSPLLTHTLAPRFDAYMRGKGKAKLTNHRATFDSTAAEDGHNEEPEDLKALLLQLPQAHWFLLADIVKLLDLIPRHSATNRMTTNALMLSLGPSLNISGGVLNDLIEQRETLFAQPPELSISESTADLIDFGDVSITPVLPPSQSQLSTRSTTPASQYIDELHNSSAGLSSNSGSTRSKRAPRLPAKPSLTKLFGHSMTSIPRQKSVDTLSSIINAEPPRVELPDSVSRTSPLPTFEKPTGSDSATPTATPLNATTPKPMVPIMNGTQPAAAVLPDTPLTSATDPLEEVHYASGTVDERSKLFSTPIADRFQGTSSPFPALRARAPRSSDGSTISNKLSDGTLSKTAENSPNANTNPATVIRRGPSVFFQSAGAGTGERYNHSTVNASNQGRSRSTSGASLLNSPSLGTDSISATTTPTSGAVAAGQKRKDELEREKDDDHVNEGRTKRLSAGPGILDQEQVVAEPPVQQ